TAAGSGAISSYPQAPKAFRAAASASLGETHSAAVLNAACLTNRRRVVTVIVEARLRYAANERQFHLVSEAWPLDACNRRWYLCTAQRTFSAFPKPVATSSPERNRRLCMTRFQRMRSANVTSRPPHITAFLCLSLLFLCAPPAHAQKNPLDGLD